MNQPSLTLSNPPEALESRDACGGSAHHFRSSSKNEAHAERVQDLDIRGGSALCCGLCGSIGSDEVPCDESLGSVENLDARAGSAICGCAPCKVCMATDDEAAGSVEDLDARANAGYCTCFGAPCYVEATSNSGGSIEDLDARGDSTFCCSRGCWKSDGRRADVVEDLDARSGSAFCCNTCAESAVQTTPR